MKIHITNYRGISTADIDLQTIALVAGQNGMGKSSIAQAVASAATGDATPIPGVKKNAAGVLVRSGTAAGHCELTTEQGSTKVNWPAATVKTTGAPPVASVYAAGLSSIVDMPDKDRIKILTDYMSATPTRADLEAKLAGMNFPATAIDRLWDLIQSLGWDGAYNQVKEKGAKLKGQWELITNDNYGTKKADAWLPPGYSPDLEGASEETLQAHVAEAHASLEAAIAVVAVSDSDRARLTELAGTIPARQKAVDDARAVTIDTTELDELKKQRDEAEAVVSDAITHRDKAVATLKALETPEETPHPSDRMFCPSCKTMLYVTEHKTLKAIEEKQPKLANAADVKAAKKAVTQAEASVTEYEKIRDDLRAKYAAASDRNVSAHAARTRAINEAELLLKQATEAQAELARLTESPHDVPSADDCRTVLAEAELRLKAYQSKTTADRLHASIGQNQELLAHLAPTGIRGGVLAEALGVFNDAMNRLTAAAGWSPVEITPEFHATYGGTPYYLLSGSEKYRVRVMLQIAMASVDNSGIMVVDEADILDKGGRNGLFKAIMAAGIPTLVCMMLLDRKDTPNLAAAGVGVSYWVEGGVVGVV